MRQIIRILFILVFINLSGCAVNDTDAGAAQLNKLQNEVKAADSPQMESSKMIAPVRNF